MKINNQISNYVKKKKKKRCAGLRPGNQQVMQAIFFF